MSAPLLSLLIPAYNEATRIGASLGQILAYLESQPYASEVVVIDDGSTDDTVAVAEKYFAAYPSQSKLTTRVLSYAPNRGKGYAVRRGLLDAKGAIAIFTDADLSTPIEELPMLVTPIITGDCDVVFGSRSLNRNLIGKHQPFLRELSGRLFNVVVRASTSMPYSDTQCGFKAFRLSVCRPIVEGALLDRFGFDVELLFLAHNAGLRLREQPVRWNDAAGSKVSMLGGLHGFQELWLVRRHYRRGKYAEALDRTRALVAEQFHLQPNAAPHDVTQVQTWQRTPSMTVSGILGYQ